MNIVETFDAVYKRGTRGEIREWSMQLGTDGEQWATRVVSGTLEGKNTQSGWSIAKAKNVGRKNATTEQEQAKAEIKAEYTKKLEKGYFVNKEDIDFLAFTKPMLATDWMKRKSKLEKSISFWSQPKLDGIRCIARADGLRTRTGKIITSLSHIEKALKPFFDSNPDAILDGELYNHALRNNFNEITSVVRKQKPTEEDVEKAVSLIEYHVYDVIYPDDPIFSVRNRRLTADAALNQLAEIVLVPTFLSHNMDHLDGLYARWMEEGYEGQMVRLDGKYENKRSNLLMKRKEFITEEFIVVAVEEGEGNWAGAVKRFVLRLDAERTFGSGVRGTHTDLTKLLDAEQPTWATVRYFTKTPDGIPRFPVVIDYGYGERED